MMLLAMAKGKSQGVLYTTLSAIFIAMDENTSQAQPQELTETPPQNEEIVTTPPLNAQNTTATQVPAIETTQATPLGVTTEHKGVSKGVKIALAILVLVSCGIAIYLTTKENKENIVVPQKPITIDDPIEDPYPVDDNIATWKEFTNPRYEFYLRYPANGVLTQYDVSEDEPSVYRVYFTPDTSKITNIESVEETDISEGLMFTAVVVKNIELKTPETSAKEKINYYNSLCPKSAKISQVSSGKLSGFDSSSFTVENCKGFYKTTYVKRKTNMYELTQYSTGDVGYEAKYRATTEKMLNNFRLTNTIAPVPLDRWIPYKNVDLNLKHPQMDDKCCVISGPVPIEGFKQFETVIILAMPNPANNTANAFNGFGVFKLREVKKENVTTLIDQQKSALIEEYKIIVGKSPEVKESTIKVSGIDAVYVRGVAWWGDMVFVPYETPGGQIILYMFGKTEVLKGEFDTLFNEILTTVEFKDPRED
jgi:hypothetical protein